MTTKHTIRTGFADIPSGRLYYEMAGEGKPLILVHSGLLDLRMWDEQFLALASNYQVIRYDDLYAGRSEPHDGLEAYKPYDNLFYLLEYLNLPKASLLGISGGALVILDMALLHPEKIDTLILAAPSVEGYLPKDKWMQRVGTQFQGAMMQQNVTEMGNLFLTMWTIGPHRTNEQVDQKMQERIRAMFEHALKRSLAAPRFQGIVPPAIFRLEQIQAPTLIVLGDKDSQDQALIGQLLQTKIASSQLAIMPDAGHTLTMEKPQEFNQLVIDFLNK